jgi:hypothetical protein
VPPKVWHLHHEEAEARAGALEVRRPMRVDYTPGRMVVHHGHTLHAIGRSPVPQVGPRIALQGDGSRTDRGEALWISPDGQSGWLGRGDCGRPSARSDKHPRGCV